MTAPNHLRHSGSATPPASTRLDRRAVWLIGCIGLVLFLSVGQRHAFGLYVLPVSASFDWDRSTFSFAIALQNLVWGLAQPFSGMLADQHGPRRVMAGGTLLYVAGLALMPFAASGWAFAGAAGVLVGLGLSGTGFGIVYGAAGKAVSDAQRPRALGIVGAFGAAGQFVMLPLNQRLIDAWGWSSAVLALAVLMAAMLPLALGSGRSGPSAAPETKTPQPALHAALRQAFGDRDFWLVGLGFLSCGFHLAFIATHLPAYLAGRGLGPQVAATALGLVALTNVAGTYLFGAWAARWQRKRLLATLYAVRTLVIALFVSLPTTALSVYLFAAAMGFLWLATLPLTNGLLGQLFGMRYITTLFGFVFLWHQIGSFLGVWLGGLVFDATGSYALVWALACVLGLVSAVANLPVRERRAAVPQGQPA